MTFRAWALAGTASIMALSGIVSASAQVPDPQVSESQPTTGPTSVFLPPANPVPPLDDRAREALRRAVKNDQRIDPQRDRWRNPEATLQFFGVRPSDTVVEIWPGQGWYTSILGPYLKQGDGKLIVGHFDAAASDSQFVRQMVDSYRARFAADTAVFGNVTVVPFGPRSMLMAPPNSVDKVLTFRNIHNWMAQSWTEKAFADFYTVLKPGGILGIEEHRGRTDEPQDPLARDGYVREDYVIQLAREAGFEFIGGAEINANPADTKDHPFGVWTLPPVSRSSAIGEMDDPGFDRRRYDEIGESDRMTLRFRKPLDATGVGLASSRPTADQIPVTIIPGPPPPPRRGRRGAPPPPVVAGVDIKPDGQVRAPELDPKAGVAAAPATVIRPAPEEPQAKVPPPPAPPPPATGRRGSATKKGPPPAPTPSSATTPALSDAAGAKPVVVAPPQSLTPETVPKATTEPASTPTPTPLRTRQRSTTPTAPKATEPTPPVSASTRLRTRSGGAAASVEEAEAKAAEPATNARRSQRRPTTEPTAAKATASKAKSKAKAKAAETETRSRTSTRNRSRPEAKVESKKKATSTAAPSNRNRAASKASPAKKSPPPAKANPNKPDWVVPPQKKKKD
jgi:predicted methyltransferase